MKKFWLALLITIMVIGATVRVARASSTTFSGSITTATSTHNPGMLSGCLFLGGAWAYTTHAFTVDQTGSYTFTEKGTPLNAFIGLYSGSFNPALVSGAGSNCMATGRDSFTVSLTAGTRYILVVEPTHLGQTGAYSVDATGPGSFNVETSVASGVGNLGGPGSGCHSKCMRINIPFGYHLVSLFFGSDAENRAALDVYCVNESGGTLGGQVTAADLSPFTTPPGANTLIKTIDSCSVPVAVYVLNSGEVEINIGPIPESKVISVVFTGLPPDKVHFTVYEPLLKN